MYQNHIFITNIVHNVLNNVHKTTNMYQKNLDYNSVYQIVTLEQRD